MPIILPYVKCPECRGSNIIKHGKRTSRGNSVQIYRCKNCSRIFSNTTLPYLNTDPATLLKGVSLYNQGYSLKRCSEIMENELGKKIPRNTIHHWIHRYEDIFTYSRIRERRDSIPIQVKSYPGHKCRFHKKKLSLIASKYPGIESYFRRILRGLKKTAFYGIDASKFVTDEEVESSLKNLVSFSSPECVYYSLCEESDQLKDLQRYLLINDSFTIGIDIPLYQKPSETGGELIATTAPIIQIRDSWVRIIEPSKDITSTTRNLIGASRALVARTDIDPNVIKIGGFNSENMWLISPDWNEGFN